MAVAASRMPVHIPALDSSGDGVATRGSGLPVPDLTHSMLEACGILTPRRPYPPQFSSSTRRRARSRNKFVKEQSKNVGDGQRTAPYGAPLLASCRLEPKGESMTLVLHSRILRFSTQVVVAIALASWWGC